MELPNRLLITHASCQFGDLVPVDFHPPVPIIQVSFIAWWRHQMETFSALLAFCAGEFTGHRWILRTKASDAELWCFPCAPGPTIEQPMETRVIWDATALIMTHYNVRTLWLQVVHLLSEQWRLLYVGWGRGENVWASVVWGKPYCISPLYHYNNGTPI